MSNKNIDPAADFKKAVENFWYKARAVQVDKGALADAADGVFLSRDRLSGGTEICSGKAWDNVEDQVYDVKSCLRRCGVAMSGYVQKTSTGKMTYRLLNWPSRFDA